MIVSSALMTVRQTEQPGAITAATVEDVALEALGTSYERLRVARPREYAIIRDSLARYGQISAATVSRTIDDNRSYELIDGFKRYHACRDLSIATMKVRVFNGGIHAVKAAIVNLNRSQGSVHAFEEALVATSLFREDKLNQQQIAALFGRHKSWACRRIALCERLCEEAIEEIRLGLLGFATAREIGRLPRGNQVEALACVHNHRLSSRETAQLVSRLVQSPRWEHENILRLPVDILDCRRPPRTSSAGTAAHAAYQRLIISLERMAVTIAAAQGRSHLLDTATRERVMNVIDKSVSLLSLLKTALRENSLAY